MSVQQQIDRIEAAKEAIATAIAGKGVTVPDGTLIDGMAALIESIEAGGGGGSGDGVTLLDSGSFKLTSNTTVSTYAIAHAAMCIPKCLVIYGGVTSGTARVLKGCECIRLATGKFASYGAAYGGTSNIVTTAHSGEDSGVWTDTEVICPYMATYYYKANTTYYWKVYG